MPKEIIIVILYVILSVIVAVLGRQKTIGFWGFFFFSMVFTPVVGLAILIIAKERGTRLAK